MNRFTVLLTALIFTSVACAQVRRDPGEAELLNTLDKITPASGTPVARPSASPGSKSENVAKPGATPKPPTEITCTKEANFDEKSHIAIFLGTVLVKDPEFTITCEKLTAYLNEQTQKSPAANGSPSPKPAPSASPSSAKPASGSGGGLKRAIAEINVVIIQDKPDPDGGEPKHYVGKSSKADYDAASGDIVLTGGKDPATWPQLQQGINTHIATEEGVVMTLNRDGKLHTKGKTKTVISDQSEMKTKPSPTARP